MDRHDPLASALGLADRAAAAARGRRPASRARAARFGAGRRTRTGRAGAGRARACRRSGASRRRALVAASSRASSRRSSTSGSASRFFGVRSTSAGSRSISSFSSMKRKKPLSAATVRAWLDGAGRRIDSSARKRRRCGGPDLAALRDDPPVRGTRCRLRRRVRRPSRSSARAAARHDSSPGIRLSSRRISRPFGMPKAAAPNLVAVLRLTGLLRKTPGNGAFPMDPIRRRLVRLTPGGLTAVSVEPLGAVARRGLEAVPATSRSATRRYQGCRAGTASSCRVRTTRTTSTRRTPLARVLPSCRSPSATPSNVGTTGELGFGQALHPSRPVATLALQTHRWSLVAGLISFSASSASSGP